MTRIARRSTDKKNSWVAPWFGLIWIGLALALSAFYFWSASRLLNTSSPVTQASILHAYLESDAAVEAEEVDTAPPMFDSSFAEYLKKGLTRYINDYDGGRPYSYKDTTYAHRHPDRENATLPFWFKKVFPLNKHLTPDKQGCFVHVGKAGGSTIGCMLGFVIHCGEDPKTNFQSVPSLLTATTAHSFHRSVYDCSDEAAYYLFTIRNPLARALSAFNYAKPDLSEKHPFSKKFKDKEIYVDCDFWTLNDFAERGLRKGSSNDASDECRDRAKKALLGTEDNLVHWYFNYQYYYEAMPPDADIVVIRNEHIVDDWNTVETLLGGAADVTKESLPVNNQYEKKPEEIYLSDTAKVVLCETLCNEIQVYKMILKRAQNIKNEQYIESMQELITSCPKEAMEESCADAKPDISEKVNGCY
mmetsp:Transcript_25602/g.36526  ORF Transcript_25602/g.36526 Transcript_25602/m.36526 type:complete len:417 (-) Transcript_25602:91-1341(-)